MPERALIVHWLTAGFAPVPLHRLAVDRWALKTTPTVLTVAAPYELHQGVFLDLGLLDDLEDAPCRYRAVYISQGPGS